MKQKVEVKVRVERTVRRTVTEYVDVLVFHSSDDLESGYTLENRAKNLVEAQIEAGHDIGWQVLSENTDTFNSRLTAEALNFEPVAIEPPPEGPNA